MLHHADVPAIRLITGVSKQRYQQLLDISTPHTAGRWIGTSLLVLAYMIRVFYLQGWYIVTYALGIYYLNLFIAFLTPKVDPVMDDDSGMSFHKQSVSSMSDL